MTPATACRARTASLGAVAPPDGAHLRRADGLAVTQERQEQWLNTYESSSQPSTARAPAGRGGARAGRGEGISVGTPRCRRIRPITAASSMSAIKRRRPPDPAVTGQHAKPEGRCSYRRELWAGASRGCGGGALVDQDAVRSQKVET